MSLQVWLPLNGNLDNYGLSNITVTNKGATIDDNGKIGKCYSFGTAKRIVITQPTNLSPKEASISCWVKISSWNTSYDSLICLSTGTGWNDTRLALVRHISTNRIDFVVSNGLAYKLITTSKDLQLNTWTHITGVFDNAVIKIYVDGILSNSTTADFSELVYDSAILNLGSWSNADNFPINGSLNDVRIYNHALSEKEIKEISKGLVLHYKLSGPGGENLLSETGNLQLSNFRVSTGVTIIDNFTCSMSSASLPSYKPVLVTKNEKYTVSFQIKATFSKTPSNGILLIDYLDADNNRQTYQWIPGQLTTEWQYVTYTVTAPNNYYLALGLRNTTGSGTVYFKNLKVEEGEKATPWCPNKADSLYHTLGYDNNIEYDCSGYKYNGNKNGSIISKSDTPRYNSSYNFNGSSRIRAEINYPQKIFTLTGWINPSSFSTYNVPFSLNTSNGSSASVCDPFFETGGGFTWGVKGATKSIGSSKILINTWTYLTIVSDGTKGYLYLNGKLEDTINSIGTNNEAKFFNIGARSSNTEGTQSTAFFKGNISDVRLYSTALSIEDIQELYQTSAIIYNNGVTAAYELMEE